VKKPKIKLHTNSTPKAANGTTATPKSAKTSSDPKSAKSKKKAKDSEKKREKEATPKEPELSPEEKHARKEVSSESWRSYFTRLTPCAEGSSFLAPQTAKGPPYPGL
jgi:hypothetical protein